MGTRHDDELRQDVDLDQLEGAPGDRSDPLIYRERERMSADLSLPLGIRWRFASLTSSRSPAGIALAVMMLTLAATVPTAVIGVILHLAAAPTWLTAAATLGVFTGVTATGIGPIRDALRPGDDKSDRPPQPPPRPIPQRGKAKSARRTRHRRK